MDGVCGITQWLRRGNPQRRVASDGRRDIGMSDMRGRVMALYGRLRVLPQQRWALCFEDSYLFTVALLATLHAGKTPVIPGHCRQSLLLEQRDAFEGLLSDQDFTLDCPVLAPQAPADAREDALPSIPDDAVIILFTSGSTGTPRQVLKPVRCLDEESRWLAALWGDLLRDGHVLASVSHQHLYGLTFRIWLPMSLGLSFDSRQILYSEQLVCREAARRYVFISSPAFLRRLDLTLTPPGCQLVISAGGVLPWSHAQLAQRWFGRPLAEIYGSTETGVLAWRTRSREEEPWRPFAGVALSTDQRQNWWARSPIIPESEGVCLNDTLTVAPGGEFQLCGRQDRIVKIEDKRISLSEVERRLLAMPGIVDAAALQVSRPARSGIGVVLVLEPAMRLEDLAGLKRRWRQELHKWLEPVAMPRFWRIVDCIPHNSQSKRAWPQIRELFDAAH